MIRTILIASHNRGWVDRCADALLEEGHLVRIAFSARMAMDAIDRVPTDLLIVDESILVGFGLDFVRACASRPQPMRVVVSARDSGFAAIPGVTFIDLDAADAVVKAATRALVEPIPGEAHRRSAVVPVWSLPMAEPSATATAI